MKMRWKGFLTVLAITVVITLIWMSIIGSMGYFHEDRIEIKRDFDTGDGLNLTVRNFDGKIDIEKWDESYIQMTFIKKTHFGKDELNKYDLIVDETDNGISLGLERKKMVHWIITDFLLNIPENVNLTDVYTKTGQIIIDDVNGDLKVESESAEITVKNVDNVSKVRTDHGGITLINCRYVGSVKANAGGIEIIGSEMVEYISVGGGGIMVRDTVQVKEANADAGGIDINVESIHEDGMILSTELGGIELKVPSSIEADYDMKADAGGVELDFPGANVSNKGIHRDDEKTGELNGGGPTIRMRADAGGLILVGV